MVATRQIAEFWPIFEVDCTYDNGKRMFTLKLSRANWNHFLVGCPDYDHLEGQHSSGAVFKIFEGIRLPKHFFYSNDAYNLSLGFDIPLPNPSLRGADYEFASRMYETKLEAAVRGLPPLPLVSIAGNDILFGYAKIEIERESPARD